MQGDSIETKGLTLCLRRYLLHIIQQPTTGCAFGSNLLSRLALAPPLIVQMQVIDRAGREIAM